MRTIVIGNGFVASHLPYPTLNDRLTTNENVIHNMIDRHTPDVIVNCIGRTGYPNIDWCEHNQMQTAEINISLPLALAKACEHRSIHLIHIGSGSIFNGESYDDVGWKETDFANPQSYYAQTKYAADLALQNMKNITILRMIMPMSEKNHQRNLINKLRTYSHITNTPSSITFMSDFVRVVDWAINNHKTGIYHVTNPGLLSPASIMNEFKLYSKYHQFETINEKQLNATTSAKRSFCFLNCDKLKNEGFVMTNSTEALRNCMKKYSETI